MNIVKDGNDYELQYVTPWRLRELLQHEKDNADLRIKLTEADASHARLIAALQWIRDNDPDCQCEHDNEDCCAEQSSGFCARCLAAKYLATEPTP